VLFPGRAPPRLALSQSAGEREPAQKLHGGGDAMVVAGVGAAGAGVHP
jgi:hypothetical protein